MKTEARRIALGGVMAALAVTFMCLAGLIPVATYVVPLQAMLLLQFVLKLCGSRIAWAWYGAVAILGLLMCPDKEAAAVFAVLGYYPIVKPVLERSRLSLLWKALLFNGTVLALYWALLHLIGLEQVVQDLGGAGMGASLSFLAMGNLVFYFLDRMLGGKAVRRK